MGHLRHNLWQTAPIFIDNLPEELFYLAEVPFNYACLAKPTPKPRSLHTMGKEDVRTKTKLKDGEPKSEEVEKDCNGSILGVGNGYFWMRGLKDLLWLELPDYVLLNHGDGLPDKERWLFLRSCLDTGETKYFLRQRPC